MADRGTLAVSAATTRERQAANATRLGPPPKRVCSVQAKAQTGGGYVDGIDTHPGLLAARCSGRVAVANILPQGGSLEELLHASPYTLLWPRSPCTSAVRLYLGSTRHQPRAPKFVDDARGLSPPRNRSRPGQGAAYRQKRGKPSEVGTPEQGP
jgi:hypothetical protein